MKEKEKRKTSYQVTICLIFCFILLATLYLHYTKTTVELTQLAPQGTRQMMGYLLKTNTGKLIVVDGGTTEDTQRLIEQIEQNGGKVDIWFLTHAHDDHVGAFTQIVQTTDIEIGTIYASVNDLAWYETYEPKRAEFTKTFLETLQDEKIKEKVIEPSLNQVIKVDNITIEILGIKNPEITENAGNEQSMVIKLKVGKTSLLLLGDTGEKSSEKLLSQQKEKLKSDIVQVAHHGQAGATKELYEAVSPNICLWPTPEWLWNNDNGGGTGSGSWKTLETRQWMEELKVDENYVAAEGEITIKIE